MNKVINLADYRKEPEDRLARIRASIEKINRLMTEVRKLEDKHSGAEVRHEP